MRRKKIIVFIVLAYAISWSIWIPRIGELPAPTGWKSSPWPHILGGLGPLFAAILTTLWSDGLHGLRACMKNRLFSLPAPKWVLFAIGIPLVFFLITWLGLGLIRGEWISFSDIGLNEKVPFSHPLIVWLVWLIFFGLGEETGWRGLLFPELCQGMSARLAALVVVPIWAIWHLPVFFYDKDLGSMGVGGTIGWVVGLAFGSMLLGWLVKRASWNLWPVILWHATFNLFTAGDRLDPLVPGIVSTGVMLLVLWIINRYDAEFAPGSQTGTRV